MHTSDDVYVTVGLALHTVVPEIGKQSEPVGALLIADARRYGGYIGHLLAAPQLSLGHMLLGYSQEHYRRPPETVAKDHYVVILVDDVAGLFSTYYPTEHAWGDGQDVLPLVLRPLEAPLSRKSGAEMGHQFTFTSFSRDLTGGGRRSSIKPRRVIMVGSLASWRCTII